MEIKKAEFIASAAIPSQYPESGMPELVLLGRSNVGKSSFVNTIANNRKLAFIGSKPGKTRTINFYLINGRFYIVDLPGYGYAKVSMQEKDRWSESIETYLKSRIDNIAGAFMLLDIRHKPSEYDKLMWQWLRYYGVSTGFVAMKADKLNKSEVQEHLDMIKKEMEIPQGTDIILFSALTKQGKNDALMAIKEALEGYDGFKV
ncbi:ribosome biogenesis GTP-binding protein YihA/YsxC [Mahella australiensis]|uniref:Probable GTP-binding protein EngB n=1 Tax=Mahella australiensis (strain DSM 15567 / CIP 107919 / 50-1 BON) TaxID=697281 RepID=F4A202_MAHA5|nr:ribosome biogenesis GTP-binding protein YihA/YsxC [Mahella australiensis]AEE96118.1 ribosome biogenesis GTP-binding protein YsxC [Mahella australiensis 50-1 BON]